MESSSNHVACLLKIEPHKPGWKKSLEKLLKGFNDVSFTIDKRSKTVYVYGRTDPQAILEKITKTGKKAEIVWSNYGRSQNPQKNQKEHLMEKGNSFGSMNAPTGFWNYHNQQQGYYPPPPNHWMMMNQPQPYHQTFGIPPPYILQHHPPRPPPYEFHQNEPAAKSFPPTPDPPKNFAMGDLQPGCKIM